MRTRTLFPLPIMGLILALVVACGSQDRSALATQTVNTYWDDVAHLHIDKAYDLLSSGNQQSVSRTNYRQNMISFLESVQGLSAKATSAVVVGDCAVVALDLHFPSAPGGVLHVFQHLYWLNDNWRITEPNGQTTQHPGKLTTCPTGT